MLTVAVLPIDARAQVFETHVPHLQNEAAGTGHSGSEFVGGVHDQGGPQPATSVGIPTAYGAQFGDLFGGAGYQRYLGPSIPERNDGAVFVGVGLGNSRKTVGVEITHATYDLMGNPLQDGSLSIKVHRHLYRGLAVAVGVEDALRYGDWISKSAFLVASQTVQFGGEYITGASATFGVGDGRFNSMDNLLREENEASLFGGGSMEIANRFNMIGSWYGQDLNLGLSLVVPGPVPLTVTPTWVSVLDNHILGSRFAISVGTTYRLR